MQKINSIPTFKDLGRLLISLLKLSKNLGKIFLNSNDRRRYFALEKLGNVPRYTPVITNVLGPEILLPDAASFLFMYREIFEQEIYKFKAKNEKPIILDGGANIGLSILYFKQLYPESKIVAFEPDIKIFEYLQKNINNFSLSNVELINKALWSSETCLEFMCDGADAGRLIELASAAKEKYQVPTTSLRDYLNQPIDLLKLDIEGAETEVIQSCKDLLPNVSNFFIEYHSFVKKTQTLHSILNILSEAGFRVYIQSLLRSTQPFYYSRTYMDMDMQLNIFAMREVD